MPDSARDFLAQLGVFDRFDVLEPPKGGVETRDVLFRKAHLNHSINVFINRQVARPGPKKITEILMPSFTQESWVRKPHYAWAHGNKVVPKRAAATMWPDDEYGTFYQFWA